MATQASAQPGQNDPVVVDSGHYSVELENERVRVLRVRYNPGEKSTMHAHPALVAVMLTDARIRFTFPDGSTEDITGAAGQAMALPAMEHLPENIGDAPFECVVIELKS